MKDDHSVISELLFTYAERIDAGDFDGVGELFAHGRIVGGRDGPVFEGAEVVAGMYQGGVFRYGDGTPRTKHVTTNVIVDVDDDALGAGARSYFTVLQAVPGSLALQPVIAGRYHDRFARVDGQWRFAEREMIVDLVGDLSQHLKTPYPPPDPDAGAPT